MEDRMNFLSNVSFFKNWDSYRLYRIAHALTQIDVNNGCHIIKNHEISKNIYFVLRGRVDIFPSARSRTALLSIQKYEYFGESGFMNSCSHMRAQNTVSEEFSMKALTRVDLLVLPQNEFHLIDRDTAEIISESFYAKKNWREQRSIAVLQETRVFRDFKRKLDNDSQKFFENQIEEIEKEKEKEKEKEIELIIKNTGQMIISDTDVSYNNGDESRSDFYNDIGNSGSNKYDNNNNHSSNNSNNKIYNDSKNNSNDTYHENNQITTSTPVTVSLADYNFQTFAPTSTYVSASRSTSPTNRTNQLQSLTLQLSTTLRELSQNCKNQKNSTQTTQNNSRVSTAMTQKNQRPGTGTGTGPGSTNNSRPGTGKSRNSGIPKIPKIEKGGLGETYLSAENVRRLYDLEDIPSLLDKDFDPFMRLGTVTTNKERAKIYNNLTYLKSPQLSRTSTYTSRKSQVENIKKYRELAKTQNPIFNLTKPSKSSMLDGNELVRNHSMGLSLAVKNKKSGNKNGDDENGENGDGNEHGNEKLTDDVDDDASTYADEYVSKTGYESSMLFGSGRIPSVKSYCQVTVKSNNNILPTSLYKR